jgi:hypothetical protein
MMNEGIEGIEGIEGGGEFHFRKFRRKETTNGNSLDRISSAQVKGAGQRKSSSLSSGCRELDDAYRGARPQAYVDLGPNKEKTGQGGKERGEGKGTF